MICTIESSLMEFSQNFQINDPGNKHLTKSQMNVFQQDSTLIEKHIRTNPVIPCRRWR